MAGKFNVLNCDVACTTCIKGYKNKFSLQKGQPFKISCAGIPKEYITPDMAEQMGAEDIVSMVSMLDPVTWAKEVLDWHCIDPEGEVWKRKTAENSLGDTAPYKEEYEEAVKLGKSAYHRPYQADALRCSSKRKIFRLGRQLGKTELLVIAMLHAVYTHKNFKVLVITPYQSQIEEIFGRLDNLIKSRPSTLNSRKRFVKAPNYTMELHNGSTIRGFTSGVKSGGNADAVRGQRANMLVFDEADYLGAQDMASALSVITNYPDSSVWMSSTPTGKREKFYDTCFDPTWKEYHLPSWANPLWSDDLEHFYRSQFTDIQYKHEVEAIFGEQEQGVYQSTYVDAAMANYRYIDQRPDRTLWRYCIGVDWNDVRVGTTIAIVGYNLQESYFKLVRREVISKEGWTQTAACNRIIQLNTEWLPEWIYIDKGFGYVQDEILRKYGYDALTDPSRGKGHPDSRLMRIVKTYDFGSKIVTKDLFTKQDREKAAKPFLVENSVRVFEQNVVQFSREDKQLESELRGYIVDHVTTTGAPVYKQGNAKIGDHNLDAFNLALVAFTLQMSSIGVVRRDSGILYTAGNEVPTQPRNPNDKMVAVATAGEDPTRNSRSGPIPESKRPGDGSSTPLWEWPGFLRDVPRPTRPTGGRADWSGSRTSRKIS